MYSPGGNKQMLPSVSAEIYVHKTHTLEVMLARPLFHGCKPLSPDEKPERDVALKYNIKKIAPEPVVTGPAEVDMSHVTVPRIPVCGPICKSPCYSLGCSGWLCASALLNSVLVL